MHVKVRVDFMAKPWLICGLTKMSRQRQFQDWSLRQFAPPIRPKSSQPASGGASFSCSAAPVAALPLFDVRLVFGAFAACFSGPTAKGGSVADGREERRLQGKGRDHQWRPAFHRCAGIKHPVDHDRARPRRRPGREAASLAAVKGCSRCRPINPNRRPGSPRDAGSSVCRRELRLRCVRLP